MAHATMLFLIHLVACVASAVAIDKVLEPVKNGTNKEVIALVMVQGAEITPNQYVSLMRAVQEASDYTVWVGIPDFILDISLPQELEKAIVRVLQVMKALGMNADYTFVAGHSQGGAIIQDYVYSNPKQFRAQILMGSFIGRKHYNHMYPVPTLTIGGELDGLCHITRIMELCYHYILHPTYNKENARRDFPVLMVKGMSHMQFASGDPPLLVRDRDLKPEITEEEAHTIVSNVIAAFLTSQVNGSYMMIIEQQLNKSIAFFKPLMTAYELEGFYHFKPPCYDNPHTSACTIGCKWMDTAQKIMGGSSGEFQINNTDEFHPVSQIFPAYHHPKIESNCSLSSKSSCVLKTLTVSQNIYDEIDKLDTGFVSTSAKEVRAKLSAREAVLQAAGHKNVDFNKTDGWSICKVINEASYAWAKNTSNPDTLKRFAKLGEPLVFGNDIAGLNNIFPVWQITPLQYKKTSDGLATEVRSPTLRTSTEYLVKLLAGCHYCKLLSPARAMEWIYVDGLRLHDSLNNSTVLQHTL